MGMVQRPAQKGFDLLIKVLSDAANFRFGDAAGLGLHHHGVERLVDPAAWLQPVGKEAALPQLPQTEDLRSRGMARVRSPTWVVSKRLRWVER